LSGIRVSKTWVQKSLLPLFWARRFIFPFLLHSPTGGEGGHFEIKIFLPVNGSKGRGGVMGKMISHIQGIRRDFLKIGELFSYG